MPTLTIKPMPAPEGYDKATGKLYQRPVVYLYDGLPLLADNLADAKDELKQTGEPVDKIEIEH